MFWFIHQGIPTGIFSESIIKIKIYVPEICSISKMFIYLFVCLFVFCLGNGQKWSKLVKHGRNGQTYQTGQIWSKMVKHAKYVEYGTGAYRQVVLLGCDGMIPCL